MVGTFVERLSAEEYHADPWPVSLSSSILNLLLNRSPRHAWAAHPRLNPDWVPDESSNEQDFGSAIHRMILEDGEDGRGIIVVDAADWRSGAAKAAREEARKSNCVALLTHKYEAAQELCAAVHRQLEEGELAGLMKGGGRTELSGAWVDPIGGPCRMRLDWLAPDSSVIIDLKTTKTNAHPEVFARQILNMGFDLQASMYIRGTKQIAELSDDPKFVFVVVEAEAPYCVSLVSLPPGWLEVSRRRLEGGMRKWAACKAEDRWPAYSTRIAYPELAPWMEERWMNQELAEARP